MVEIISVRFKDGGKSYYFNPNGLTVAEGEKVIIETARGVEFGECTEGNTMIDEMALLAPLRPVLRLATPEDEKKVEENHKKEAKAAQICQQKIAEHKLEMKLVDVEYNFEGNKILFFFTAEGRVDFRELVKDLASVFRTRIELRQIGVRDEAKMLGGLGICGRPFCCSSFLEDFQPVSIKMAKTQNLSLNPTKISGTCGRLMCCLKYEQEAYEDAVKRAPKMDSLVETPDGVGTISQVNLLRETVKVRLDLEPEQPRCYGCDEIRVVRSGKGKRPEGYELPEPGEKPAPRLRKTLSAPPGPVLEQPAAPHWEDAPDRPEAKDALPAAEAAGARPAEGPSGGEGERRRRRNHRSRRPKGDGAKVENGGAAPVRAEEGERKPQQPRPNRKNGNRPPKGDGTPRQPEEGRPQGEGGEKPKRHRPHRRRDRKPPAPPAE